MTWIELAQLLWVSRHGVMIDPKASIPDAAGWLRGLAADRVRAADQVARDFARDWQWPAPLEHHVRCQLYFRVLLAIEIIRRNARANLPQPRPSPESTRRLLETLLIEDWHQQGMTWVEATFPARPGGRAGSGETTSRANL